MRTLTSIFLAAILSTACMIVLTGCKTTGSHRLPQPDIPSSFPSPPPTKESSSLPSPSPTGESSSHSGCRVSRDHPVAESVKQFLLPIHKQLIEWADLTPTGLAVPDHSIKVYGQEEGPCINLGSDGAQHVGLTPNNDPPEDALYQSGSKYIYQYTHELAHILSNWEEASQYRFKWFEETMSELASLHTLRANGRHSYANRQITEYAAKRANISDFDASGRVSEWYPEAIVRLGQNSTIRELNGAIACELLPHFENDPKLWESVTHINKWDRRSDDFRSYLDHWEQRLLSKGVYSNAPEIVKAVLYGEGNISEPPLVCNRIVDIEPTPEEAMGGGGGDAEGALHESMEDYDREIARERVAMSSAGQGMASAAESRISDPGNSSGAMVTIPNMPIGTTDGIRSTGTAGASDPKTDSEVHNEPTPKFEIPEDIAKARGDEDPVARQIREAAEQEENPRLREALWEEYRKHTGLRSE